MEGVDLQKLHDKLKQMTNGSPQNRSIKAQVISQNQMNSESEESIVYIENKQNPFTMVTKHQVTNNVKFNAVVTNNLIVMSAVMMLMENAEAIKRRKRKISKRKM